MKKHDYKKLAQSMNLYRDPDSKLDRGFHTHELYEFVIPVKGELSYLIEKNVYSVNHGSLLMVNNTEVHRAIFPQPDKPIERFFVHFSPFVLDELDSTDSCLSGCFLHRRLGERNKLILTKEQWFELNRILHRIELNKTDTGDGCEILKIAYMLELLVFVNRLFRASLESTAERQSLGKLSPIVEHIELYLEKELTLESLENVFYINGSYLSRSFKEKMGVNLHDYIVLRRISRAKKLLSEGMSVSEACQQSGFNDYSNFIRCFKGEVGVPPGKYGKIHRNM